MKTITASDANRHFSSLLRDVATGEVITILSRGKPVAIIGPAQPDRGACEIAKRHLLGRLRQQQSSGARDWTRNQLYEG